MDIYVLTRAGIEEIAASEVEELGCKVEYFDIGIVKAKGNIRDVIRLNIYGRTFVRVLLGVCEGELNELNDIIKQVSNIDFKTYFKEDYSFAVRCNRIGKHNFTSIDAAREVGGIIHKQLLNAKMNVKVDLENPTIEFILRIYHNKFHLGIDTSGKSLDKRGYRVYNHPAALNPVLASAMIKLLKWDGKKVLIDPMCGGATIPIEAVMSILKYAPGLYRNIHPIVNIPFVSKDEYLKIREEALKARVNSDLEIAYAIDISNKHLTGAIKNAESAGVKNNIRFMLGDATKLSNYIEKGEYFFAFNPPYGIRESKLKNLLKLYKETLSELIKIGAFKGAIITAATNVLEKAINDLKIKVIERKNVMHGDLKASIYILEI